MTYQGRSPDDMPLAAYGGRGAEPPVEPAVEPDHAAREVDVEVAPSIEATSIEAPPPGPFAHAVPAPEDAAATPDAAAPDGPRRALPIATVVATLRTSRVAAGTVFTGVILVGLLLLNGSAGRPGAAGAQASPTPAPVVVVTPEPGAATLVLTGKVEQSLAFGGSTGAGAPGAPLAATWSDPTGSSLALSGPPDRGTRATDASLVLQFTVVVGEAPVTFTSTDGECTIGMALHPRNVSGTFSCRKLRSDDGKHVVGASGTYRT